MNNTERTVNTSRAGKHLANNVQPAKTRTEYRRREEARKRQLRVRRTAIFLVIAMLVLCIVLLFRACGKYNSIVGTWDYDTVTVYRFDKGGEGALQLPNNSYDFSYSTEEDTLFIDFENENVTDHTYTFNISDGELTLNSVDMPGMVYVLTKKA